MLNINSLGFAKLWPEARCMGNLWDTNSLEMVYKSSFQYITPRE